MTKGKRLTECLSISNYRATRGQLATALIILNQGDEANTFTGTLSLNFYTPPTEELVKFNLHREMSEDIRVTLTYFLRAFLYLYILRIIRERYACVAGLEISNFSKNPEGPELAKNGPQHDRQVTKMVVNSRK
ncbi:hypothetical protein TNCV_1930071 [Trichonephila clavipes]|nr:hypothetical protein TNCV_1930071 [Trichonephila clavipes]